MLTTASGIPYVEATDDVSDYPTTMAALAALLELRLPTPAIALPAGPVDKQRAILTDSLAAPTYSWLLQYLAAAGGWIFLGGSELVSETGVTNTSNNAAYTTLANDPAITLPRAGSYDVLMSALINTNTHVGEGYVYTSFKIGAAAALDANGMWSWGDVAASGFHTPYVTSSRKQRISGVAAATVLQMQEKVAAGGSTINFGPRTLRATPVLIT